MMPLPIAAYTALGVKIAILALLMLYSLFAFIITRQVGIMNRVIPTPVGPVISLIAFAHFASALILIVFALGIL